MFSWFKKSSIDPRATLVIEDDQKRRKARANYVKHEEARAYNQTSIDAVTLPVFIPIR